ncbi:MAG: hypothetical protein R3E79_56530 [Caldilineaceae bacterium]
MLVSSITPTNFTGKWRKSRSMGKYTSFFLPFTEAPNQSSSTPTIHSAGAGVVCKAGVVAPVGQEAKRIMAKDDRDEASDVSGQQGNRTRSRRISEHAQQRQADGTHITSIDRSRRAHQRLIALGKRTPVTLDQFQQFKELFT